MSVIRSQLTFQLKFGGDASDLASRPPIRQPVRKLTPKVLDSANYALTLSSEDNLK